MFLQVLLFRMCGASWTSRRTSRSGKAHSLLQLVSNRRQPLR